MIIHIYIYTYIYRRGPAHVVEVHALHGALVHELQEPEVVVVSFVH